MAFTNATKEAAALEVASLGAYISVHTGDPGTTGANEAVAGATDYVRKQTTWAAGTADGVVTGSQVQLDVPAGTYGWAGIWTAATGGVYVGGFPIEEPVVMTATGKLDVTPTVQAT